MAIHVCRARQASSRQPSEAAHAKIAPVGRFPTRLPPPPLTHAKTVQQARLRLGHALNIASHVPWENIQRFALSAPIRA